MSKELPEGYVKGTKCPDCGQITAPSKNPFGTDTWVFDDIANPQYNKAAHTDAKDCIRYLRKLIIQIENRLPFNVA